MGYISEICLVVAVRTPEQADELAAIYAMHTFVKRHDLVSYWKRYDRPEGVFFTYYNDCTKWYSEYEVVQGMTHLLDLAKTFNEERTDVGWIPDDGAQPEITYNFPYAAYSLRIGEEYTDIEIGDHGSDPDLLSVVFDRAYLTRKIHLDF